jgi:hypothetical protein
MNNKKPEKDQKHTKKLYDNVHPHQKTQEKVVYHNIKSDLARAKRHSFSSLVRHHTLKRRGI